MAIKRLTELARRAAPAQAGIFAHVNPAVYNSSDPIRLWVIQLVIIIAFTRLLGLFFGRIRQPRVIAEVIGGILLGPTVLGRIPHFTSSIFPTSGMPLLNLTANIGLVLFLFIVGLELDLRAVRKNARSATVISLAGLILPLGLGAALGVAVYRQFVDSSVNYGYFILFTAVAVGITAFPVLCRILTEVRLLDTPVGVAALAAGVGNDVVGWILLALAVALVNSGDGITAVWVLLTGAGFVLFMLLGVSQAYWYLAKWTGSLEAGTPTPMVMAVTLLILFVSAFFTDIIGIHAIFGGFLAGLVIPHDNGYAIAIVEKIEDLVSIIFLPLYFILSGLQTDLSLLNTGKIWGYVVLICTVAFFSKFLGCGIAAKFMGFRWRESGAIGSLMACKGLVELIVLNVGYEAGILDERTFSMFVVHAIILTFITTPLTLLFYPAKYRSHIGSRTLEETHPANTSSASVNGPSVYSRFALVADRVEQLPAIMSFMQLLESSSPVTSSSESVSEKGKESSVVPLNVDLLRLVELTERTSAVLRSQAADLISTSDPVLSVLRTFAHLRHLAVNTAFSVLGIDEFSSSIVKHVQNNHVQMILLPWATTAAPGNDNVGGDTVYNPFTAMFSSNGNEPASVEQVSSVVYAQFVRRVFAESPVDVAVFMDRGLSNAGTDLDHIFVPFFGGPDDRLALNFVVQLCGGLRARATVLRIRVADGDELSERSSLSQEKIKTVASQTQGTVGADTVYGDQNTQMLLQSHLADDLLWSSYTRPTGSQTLAVSTALGKITFEERTSPRPLRTVAERLRGFTQPPLVMLGRSRRVASGIHHAESKRLASETIIAIPSEVAKTLGEVGAAVIASGSSSSLLVMQART